MGQTRGRADRGTPYRFIDRVHRMPRGQCYVIRFGAFIYTLYYTQCTSHDNVLIAVQRLATSNWQQCHALCAVGLLY